MSDPPTGRFSAKPWIALSLGGAVLIPLLALALIAPMVQDLPAWDQWSMVEVFEAHASGQPVLPLLLKPYAGHLNVVPRAMFFGLGLISHWNLRLEVLLSFLFAAATLAILLRMLADTRRELLILGLAVATEAFCLSQFENLMSGYPMGQVLSQLAATACIYLLTREVLSVRSIAAAAGCALLATFSWGAGFVTWPLDAGILLARRGWRAPTLLWGAACGGIALLVRGQAGPIAIAWKLLPKFALTLLGTAFPQHAFPSPSEATTAGAACFIAFIVAVALAWRHIDRLSMLRWSSLAALALTSATIIALGRSYLPLAQATASHYATATYPLVVATTVLLGCAILGGGSKVRISLPRLVGMFVLTGAIALHATRVSWRAYLTVRSWQPTVMEVRARLLAGDATDQDIQRASHPDPALVRHGMDFLRQQRLTHFADSSPLGER